MEGERELEPSADGGEGELESSADGGGGGVRTLG